MPTFHSDLLTSVTKIDLNRQMQEVFKKKNNPDYRLLFMQHGFPLAIWEVTMIKILHWKHIEKFEKVKHTSLQKEKKKKLGYKWGRGEFKEKWGNRK